MGKKHTLKRPKSNTRRKYNANRFAFHCHCGETREFLLELLKKAKEENVGVLSINNYKSLGIFTEVLPQLSEEDIKPYRNIKILPSIEMPARFNFTNVDGKNYNIEVHILGYGVDIEKEKLLQQFCEENYKTINQEEELQRLIKIGHNIGLKFEDEDVYLDSEDDNRKYAGRAFVQALMKNMDENFCKEGEDNKNKLPFELRTNWRAFQNRCVKDVDSPFYFNIADCNPDVSEVIKLIHKMGGLAYLAHPSAYFAKTGCKGDIEKANKNVVKFAADFLNIYSPKNDGKNKGIYIDGTEKYHPSYLGNKELMSEIQQLIKKHRIGSSGGTDIHVDNSLGRDETVSSDSLRGNVTKNKIRRTAKLRKKAILLGELLKKAKAKVKVRPDKER